MNKNIFSIITSVVLIIVLVVQGSSELWPGIVFFIIQAFLLLAAQFVIGLLRRKGIMGLIPVVRLYQAFFAAAFPIWILLAVLGLLVTPVGRFYVIALFVIFFALAIVLMLRLLTSTDLLDRFK